MSTLDEASVAPATPAPAASPASAGADPGPRGPGSFAVRVSDVELEPEPLDPDQIVSGAPEVTGKVLWESADGKQIRGIWQITPGVVTDTEADELFVVVSGRATVEVAGGESLEIGPGDACVLRAGDRTTWTVHETLRKAYHISL